jgi:hypothetical protein
MYVVVNLIYFTFKTADLGLWPFIQDLLPAQVMTEDLQLFSAMVVVGLPAVIIPIATLFVVGGLASLIPAVGGITFTIDIVIIIILAVAFAWALLKILWILLKAYITVVLSLIFSPFILLVGAMPGSNVVSSWFRNLIANLAIFPVVFVMVFLAGYLSLMAAGEPFRGWIEGTLSFSSLVGAFTSPATQIGNIIVMIFVSAGILLMTPKAGELIQSFIQKRPFDYGTALGQATGLTTIQAGIEKSKQEQIATIYKDRVEQIPKKAKEWLKTRLG